MHTSFGMKSQACECIVQNPKANTTEIHMEGDFQEYQPLS